MSEPAIAYRSARRDDLPAAARVTVQAEDELAFRLHGSTYRGGARLGGSAETAALNDLAILHTDATEQVWVALAGERVVGVAAAAIRGRHWHLVSLFVAPEYQDRGIGRGLLSRLHAVGQDAGCDIFSLGPSRDPRALTLYLALGLAPHAPTMIFTATDAVFPPTRWEDELASQPLDADDVALINTLGDIDKLVRGVRRPDDWRRWLAVGAAGALLTRHDTATPAGYYLVGDEPAFGRIGPVAAMDEERFPAILGRALAAAGQRHRPDQMWQIVVPGENRAAIAPLLKAGFRPDRLGNFFGSSAIGRWDRYIFHDENML